jgi:hypothetical protein
MIPRVTPEGIRVRIMLWNARLWKVTAYVPAPR